MLYAILKPLIHTMGRGWLRLSAVGTELVPRDGPLLLASNHSSLLDPPLIGSVLPRELDYIAKTELFRIPRFGGLIRRLNAHPVDRTGSDSAALRLALRLLGELYAMREPPEDDRAEDHYRKAFGLAEQLGMRPLQAHSHLGLGHVLARRGEDGAARASLSAAEELFRACGMTSWIEQARRTAAS